MSLPSYADLGKSVKDLFSKGYHFGQIKVSTKTRTCHDVEVATNTTHSIDESTTVADIQGKYNLSAYGLTFVNKWTTENIFSKEVTCQDYLTKGLKLGMEIKCNIGASTKAGILMAQYKLQNGTLDLSMEGGDDSNLIVNASGVAGYNSYIAGYQVAYDTNDGNLKKNNMCVGYLGSGFSGLLNLINLENVIGTYYQQVNPSLEIGLEGVTKSDDGPTFSIGAKYTLDPSGVAVRGKVDNKSLMGVGCELKVADGATLLFSANIDLKDFSGGAHKVGMALEFQ